MSLNLYITNFVSTIMKSVTYDKSGKDLLKRVDRFRASSERVMDAESGDDDNDGLTSTM